MNLPDGFQTITPYIFTDTPDLFATFLEDAFDAKEMGRSMRGGRIANLQMRIGTVTLMISQSEGKYTAQPTAFYIYVENADDSMARAIAAGARLEMEVMDMSYDDRQGGVVDPIGNIWWVSQRLVEKPYFSE
jgi:PhnB protein